MTNHRIRRAAISAGAVAIATLCIAAPASANSYVSVTTNNVIAVNLLSNHEHIKSRFVLHNTSASAIDATNNANSQVRYCHDCGGAAVAFEVVLDSDRPEAVTAHNNAKAVSVSCETCANSALAYQFIVGNLKSNPLTSDERAHIAAIASKVEALEHSSTPVGSLQGQTDALASELLSVLQGSSPSQRFGAQAATRSVTVDVKVDS